MKKGILFFTLLTSFLLNPLNTLAATNNPVSSQASLFKSVQVGRPLVIAHRGGAGLYPENTMEAVKNSINIGVDVIELDVNLTKDNVLVLGHDSTIDRVSDGSGAIRDYTFDELKKFNFGFNFKRDDGTYPYRNSKIQISSLEEVFKSYPGFSFIIEIKSSGELGEKTANELFNLMNKYNMYNNVLVSSFYYGNLNHLSKMSNSQTATALLSGDEKTYYEDIKNYLFIYKSGLTPEQKLERNSILNFYHGLNFPVYTWTVNDKNSMIDLINSSVDGIVTDRPDILIQLLNK